MLLWLLRVRDLLFQFVKNIFFKSISCFSCLLLEISLSDVAEVGDPLDKVVSGLQTNGDVQIPLKSVHVRAKLVDLAAQASIDFRV